MKDSFHIGGWSVDSSLGTLTKHGTEVHLEPRAMQVLVYLADHAGEVVSKEELFQKVWEETFVTDEALTYCIWNLRKALGDQVKNPRFIQTIPKKGYRLIAAVAADVAETWGIEVERGPYPGLAPFSEADAQYFFGREEEVALLRERLTRLRLLTLIGASGVGKSSLIRAGLLPSLPQGWRAAMCRPGEKPFSALAEALVPEVAGDTEATRALLWMTEPNVALTVLRRWQAAHVKRLLVVDQFEELFTLTPEEVQAHFVEILGRAAQETGLHVLLVLRDDFLMHCQKHKCLEPVFSELTPLGPPSPDALHRALVEPARNCGYVFEDETLPEEMVAEVGKERGALPLLAFAAARLWDNRERDRKLLTRKAYQEIGGVAGALAQHAESTLERIGIEHQDIAREIFRNLMTAQGTRATRDREELLSVFPDRDAAEGVLTALIGARLLTSYELPAREGEASTQRVEIIHESLLQHWPRMVRWQTQDADSALLRDQLRQAAHLWTERGRPVDLLWTGTSFKELQVWCERYAGRLTTTEEMFVGAIFAYAGRRRRKKRFLAVAAMTGLLVVIASVTTLWRLAVLEVRRREASEVLALGRLQLEDYPTAALAHAIASLERADSPEARRFALEALWRGPTAFVLAGTDNNTIDFSPDGQWLAAGGMLKGVLLWSSEGGPPRPLLSGQGFPPSLAFSPDGSLLFVASRLTGNAGKSVLFLSVPEGREIGRLNFDGATDFRAKGKCLFTFTDIGGNKSLVQSWPLPSGDPMVLGHWDRKGVNWFEVDALAASLVYARGRGVYLRSLIEGSLSDEKVVGEHETEVWEAQFDPGGQWIASGDESGEIRFWAYAPESQKPHRQFKGSEKVGGIALDPTGSWMVSGYGSYLPTSTTGFLWDLRGPPDADPLPLRIAEVTFLADLRFHPKGRWLALANAKFTTVWPLNGKYARVLRGHSKMCDVAFTPDGRSLVSASREGTVRIWPLSPDSGERSRVLLEDRTADLARVALDESGRNALTSSRHFGLVHVIPLDGEPPRRLLGLSGVIEAVALGNGGRLAAAAAVPEGFQEPEIRIWNLTSGEVQVLEPPPGNAECGQRKGWEAAVMSLEFMPDGRLLTAGGAGIRLWNLETGESENLRECRSAFTRARTSRNGRYVIVQDVALNQQTASLSVYDLVRNTSWNLVTHGNRALATALDTQGTLVVTGDEDGVVRVGPITGEEPHLLFGHRRAVSSVAVSPDGRWIASGAVDGEIRLWPIPQGQPLHMLPYEELLARLHTLTNLRVVADKAAETGHRLEPGPFPGWKKVPQW